MGHADPVQVVGLGSRIWGDQDLDAILGPGFIEEPGHLTQPALGMKGNRPEFHGLSAWPAGPEDSEGG